MPQAAVVKESLRIGPGGIPGVLSRVTPTKGLTISGSVIPQDVSLFNCYRKLELTYNRLLLE